MKNFNKIMLIMLILGAGNSFADDFWFISPEPNQSIGSQMTIQIQPPFENKNVKVWIEKDSGWFDQTVWRGKLTAANNYTITVDTRKFKPGMYELNAKYYLYGEDYDAELKFWINGSSGSADNGTYFPQN